MLLAFDTAFALEFGLFFGVILALACWELYRTHKISVRGTSDPSKPDPTDKPVP
ncbi:MAG: hypothetical protein AAF253_00160 [Pseudomonadota bacterium]